MAGNYTKAELQTAVSKASPNISTENRPHGIFDATGELARTQATAAAALLADPDTALYLHKLAKQELGESLRKSLEALAALKTTIAGTSKGKAPQIKQKEWIKAHRASRRLQEVPGDAPAQEDLAEALDDVTRQLGPTSVRSHDEMSGAAQNHLGNIVYEHGQILAAARQIPLILSEYADSYLTDHAVAAQAAQTQAVLDDVALGGQEAPRDAAATLQASKTLLDHAKTPLDPTKDKLVGVMTATGTSNPAEIKGIRSAPFRFTDSIKVLTYTVDGEAGTWTLPAATAPSFQTRDTGGDVTIVATGNATISSIAAPEAGDLWDVVRVENAGDFQVTGNMAQGLSDLGGLGIFVGDLIWLAGIHRITAISGKTALLDGMPITTGLHSNVKVFIDGRLTVLVDGVETVLEYMPVTPLVTTISGASLAGNMGNPSGGLLSVVSHKLVFSSNTTGPTSSIRVTPSPMYTMLGLNSFTDNHIGEEANHKLKFKVVTSTDPDGTETEITLTGPGTLTMAAVASAITAVPGITATEDPDPGVHAVTIKTTELGSLAELTIVAVDESAYSLLALDVGTAKRGTDVGSAETKESADNDFPGKLEIKPETPPDLGTATALGSPSPTLSFPSAGGALFDQISAGDVLGVTHASGVGYYEILSADRDARTVTMTTSLPTGGGYTPTIKKDYPVLTSKATDKTSAITLSKTDGADVARLLGIALGETRGKAQELELGDITGLRPIIRVGDIIIGFDDEMKITELADTSVKVDPLPDNDISGSGTVVPLGAHGLEALKLVISAWAGGLGDYLDLSAEFLPTVIGKLEDRDLSGATTAIEAYEILIQNLNTSLLDSTWDANTITSVDLVLGAVKSRALDRAEDLLRQGALKDFFQMGDQDATYKQRSLAAMATLAASTQSDLTADGQLDEVPVYSASAEEDFSDGDLTDLGISGDLRGDEY